MRNHEGARGRHSAGRVFAVVAVAFLASAVVAEAAITWRGGFETGNLSEWDKANALPGRVTVVTDPVREGVYAGRFEVRPGDNPLPWCECGERAEVVKHTRVELPGTVSWWAWSAYFPAEFAVRPGGRIVFSQWHDYGSGHPVPVVIRVESVGGVERFAIRVMGGRIATPVIREWALQRVERGRLVRLRRGLPLGARRERLSAAHDRRELGGGGRRTRPRSTARTAPRASTSTRGSIAQCPGRRRRWRTSTGRRGAGRWQTSRAASPA
jgi:hypothetical protein